MHIFFEWKIPPPSTHGEEIIVEKGNDMFKDKDTFNDKDTILVYLY